MSELTIWQNGASQTVTFSGQPMLSEILTQAGYLIAHPCGGRGTCRKCAVELEGAVSSPNEAELKANQRLSCQARLLGNTSVILPDTTKLEQIETGIDDIHSGFHPMPGHYGASVDIGTTTLAVRVYDLTTGKCIGEAAARNSQTAVAADVMGRIDSACKGNGSFLQRLVLQDIDNLLKTALKGADPSVQVHSLVLTGNTTMLYLLNGLNPESLSHAPFHADNLFDVEMRTCEKHAYLPPCISAFVGADITCAILASGMCKSNETALLCDIGTNGEIALWNNGQLFVTSTAAGPAFEGAGISCGCGSVQGAIDQVWLQGNELQIHTICNTSPIGICGSGLIDAIAAGLICGCINETGSLADEAFTILDTVCLIPQDIRAVQLAKAAIAAGIETLTETAGISAEDIKTLYIAGGFGSHLNVESAATIGLIPSELKQRVKILGNASLSGAVSALLDTNQWERMRAIASCATHVDLGGNPKFNDNFIEHMMFE